MVLIQCSGVVPVVLDVEVLLQVDINFLGEEVLLQFANVKMVK